MAAASWEEALAVLDRLYGESEERSIVLGELAVLREARALTLFQGDDVCVRAALGALKRKGTPLRWMVVSLLPCCLFPDQAPTCQELKAIRFGLLCTLPCLPSQPDQR